MFFNIDLGGGEGVSLPASWFSLNNSDTAKAITLAFCSIEYHFIRDVLAKFGIPCLLQSRDIEKTQTRVFPISGFLVNPL